MSSTPQSQNAVCTHERRPGTTVCLLCRQEARVAASDRRNKLILRGTAAAIVVAVLALGLSNTKSLREWTTTRPASPSESAAKTTDDTAAAAAPAATTAPAADSVIPQGGTAATSAPTPANATVTSAPTTPVAPSASAAVPPVTPTIGVGVTALGGGATATRSDTAVLVAFDTPELRTRTPEKFERFLRTTLAQIYGRQVETQLASIPLGKITAQGNLLYELPTRGIRLPAEAGWHLEVFPEIRPGDEGPLVVRYRVSVVKD